MLLIAIQTAFTACLNKPRGLSWCSLYRRIAVADYENHRVIILDELLNLLCTIRGPVAGDTFKNPIDVAFDINGFLYILDSRNNRVVVMSDDFMQLVTFGSIGRSDGKFDNRKLAASPHCASPLLKLSRSLWNMYRWKRKSFGELRL
jgi:tripartite motif-containing protein 2/3/tripartite motif-containing protein 71